MSRRVDPRQGAGGAGATAGAPGDELTRWLEATRAWADAQLERFVPPAEAHPTRLAQAMRYALFGGGKRLRPAVLLLVARELGGRDEDAALPAAAIECVHTYSLVHDDLPCMDDDLLRRGRPTCHVAFDVATAVLAGDALLTLAFELLARAGGARGALLSEVLARAAGADGMVGGQVLDLYGATEPLGRDARLAAVTDTHLRKTARLFGAAAEMGAIAAAAPDGTGRAGPPELDELRRRARAFGQALGLCFQAVDDLLDVTGDAATLGKTPGKDAALARPTLVAVLGVEAARAHARALAEDARRAAADLGLSPGGLGPRLVERLLDRTA